MIAAETNQRPNDDPPLLPPFEAMRDVGVHLGCVPRPDFQGACESLSQYLGGWVVLDLYDSENRFARRAEAYRGKSPPGPLPLLDQWYYPASLPSLTHPKALRPTQVASGWLFRPGWRAATPHEKRAAIWISPLVLAERCLGLLTLSAIPGSAATVGLIDSISRLFAFAAETERLGQEATRIRSMRDEMLSVVSHDLKNPLTAMLVSASLLEERAARMAGEQGGRLKKLSSSIRRSAERMNGMLSDLLDIVRMEAGRLSIENQAADFMAMFDEANRSVAMLAEQRGVAIDITRTPVQSVWVAGDRERLLRVTVNLLTCALQAAPAGSKISVEVELDGAPGDNPHVVLTITDHGVTLNEEQRKSIFSALWRTPDQPKGPGGLSLTASRGIVEHHGGLLEYIPLQTGNRLRCRLPTGRPPNPV